MVLSCAVLSAWELVRSITRAHTEARALKIRNQLVMDNYRSIEAKLRENAAQQHEFNHRLAAMDAQLQERDFEGLERSLASWRSDSAGAGRVRFTENIAVNAIMQDAASRAGALGVTFRASAQVPRELSLPEEDVCTLLMNMLDNAIEGVQRTPEGRERHIRFQVRDTGGLPRRAVREHIRRVRRDGRAGPAAHCQGRERVARLRHSADARRGREVRQHTRRELDGRALHRADRAEIAGDEMKKARFPGFFHIPARFKCRTSAL